MNRRAMVAAAAILILLVGGYFIDKSRAENEARLSGFFEIQPTQVSSRVGGRVSFILVKEGDAVKKGQPLIRFEAATNEAALDAQRHAAEAAEQQFLETKHGSRIEDVQKQEDVLSEQIAAYRRVLNGPLPEEIRSARDRLKEMQAKYAEVKSGARPEEIASARAAAGAALEKFRQSQRGLTTEERAELQARAYEADAAATLAKKDLDRAQVLYSEGAISRQQFDTTQSAYQQAAGRQRDAQQAYLRAQRGTPPEELAQAKRSYEQADAQYKLVKNGNRREDIDAARQEMLQAGESLKLLLRGSRKEDIDAAKARVDQAKAQLAELKRGNRAEDIAKAKQSAEQARAQAQSLGVQVEERILYAPTDGNIDRVLVADGDLVPPNAPVIQMSNPGDLWVRVYVPESDLTKVKVGDRADLVFDGISGTLPGVVESIATQGEFTPANLQSPDERAKQVFGVRIRLAHPDPRIKAGMYVTVKRVGSWR